MTRARALLAAAVTVVALAAPLAFVGPAAAAGAAESPAAIDLDAGADLLAVQPTADAPGHLVVAGYLPGRIRTGVVVTDAGGANPVTVSGITDVQSVALAPDGRTVWAASHDDVIGSFSSDDPSAAPQLYPTGANTCPRDLAVASDGRVYFIAGCADTGWTLNVLDPVSKAVSPVAPVGLVTGTLVTLGIENTPARPDVLAVFEPGHWVDLLDVSGAAPSELGAIDPVDVATVDVAPDGQSVLVSDDSRAGGFGGFGSYRYTISATPTRSGGLFQADGWPVNGLAVDPTGTYVAASSYGEWFSYGPSSEQVLRAYGSSTGYDVSLGRGVAWVGATLFTMATDVAQNEVLLVARPDAVVAPTTLTASGPASAQIDTQIRVSGYLTDRGAPIAWASLTVTRTDYYGTKTYSTHTGPGGKYILDDTPNIGGGNTYRVSYAGTGTRAPATATYVLSATRLPTFLSIGTDHPSYQYGQLARVTAHLGTTYTERHVTIYAQRVGGTKKPIAYGVVDKDGKLHAAIHVYHNTVFSASFAGDRRHQPVAVTVKRNTGADPELTLENYYGTDSAGYRLYHKSQEPKLHAHVNPSKDGECVYFDVQEYVSGGWRDTGSSDCFRLGSGSSVDAYWNAPARGVVGRTYRAGFWWPGDSENAGTGSLFRYFKLTS
jgi:hypothetical protein